MRKITNLENIQMKKVMTHELVNEITRTMNEVNFAGFEGRVKQLILTLIEKPLQKMGLNEQLLEKYTESTRKIVRRQHEMEYIIQKFQKVSSGAENFDKRFNELDQKLKS